MEDKSFEILENLYNPDIIIEYSYDSKKFMPIAVIFVRPETNNVSYEKSILKGIEPYANVIYMANLSGKLFIKDALILDHYAPQYRFAIFGKDEINKYPEMVKEFERYFRINFKDAKIIGAFEALIRLKIKAEDLFSIFVGDKDFLSIYGQTIKKIDKYYIINYDLPALIDKYNTNIDIFTIAILLKDENYTFSEINKSILKEIKKNDYSQVVDKIRLRSLNLLEWGKRIYHFSQNHIKAMYDMIDFVFKSYGKHLDYCDTPLGRLLLDNNISVDKLKRLKEYPLIYIKKRYNKKYLVNIMDEAEDKSVSECIKLIKKVYW